MVFEFSIPTEPTRFASQSSQTWLREYSRQARPRGFQIRSRVSPLCAHQRSSEFRKVNYFSRSVHLENLWQVLRDVISQRKEASAFYRPKSEADQGHAYYITALENTLKTFEISKNERSTETKSRQAAPTHSKKILNLAMHSTF